MPRCACHSRRSVLSMLAGVAAAGVAPGARAQGGEGIVDVHHHIYPPRYTTANLRRLLDMSSDLSAAAYTGWTPRQSLDAMDQAGIRASVCSITAPGIWFGDHEEGRVWARDCNEFGAGMARDFPGRFGMFAALPLPDVDGSLREIEHAFDTLKLDGIGLLTSYAGKPLGDPTFAPVFDELNRREAVVFVHPTSSCCAMAIPGLEAGGLDFPTDTTRAIVSLAFSGAFARWPGIRFIFAHGGGTLPMIATRITAQARRMGPEELERRMPGGFEATVKRQFYDLAGVSAHPPGMAAVLAMFPIGQILFGTDAPFTPARVVAQRIAGAGLSADQLRAVRRENAVRLLPRFA